MGQAELLRELELSLQGHLQKDESVENFFNRQLQERVSGEKLDGLKLGIQLLRLSAEVVEVCDEEWHLDRLIPIAKWHTRTLTASEGRPLVIFRGWGMTHLIDGNNRVNIWKSRGDLGPHRSLIVTPRPGVANFLSRLNVK